MTSDIILRYFKSKDAQECSTLMQDHFRIHAANLSIGVRTRIADGRTTEYIRKIATNRTIVVALIDNKIVGMGALKGNEIRHMYIQLEYQGKGIGSKIMSFLEKEAYYKGFSSIIVNSVSHSEEFYIKNGFQSLIKTQIVRHGSILEAILLEKFLE